MNNNTYLQELKLFHTQFQQNFQQYQHNLLQNIQFIKQDVKSQFLTQIDSILSLKLVLGDFSNIDETLLKNICIKNNNTTTKSLLDQMFTVTESNLFDSNLKTLNLNYKNELLYLIVNQIINHDNMFELDFEEKISKDYYFLLIIIHYKSKPYWIQVIEKLDHLYKSDQLSKINYIYK